MLMVSIFAITTLLFGSFCLSFFKENAFKQKHWHACILVQIDIISIVEFAEIIGC
jgi:hypothetical protein